MDTNIKRSTIAGMAAGLLSAGLLALLVVFCGESCVLTQKAGMFFGSTPVYLASAINSSDPFVTAVYLIYWTVLGGLFGFLLGLKRPVMIKVVIGLALVLVVVHYLLMVQVTRAIEDAIKALAGLFP